MSTSLMFIIIEMHFAIHYLTFYAKTAILYTIQNEFGYIHLAVNSEILFLLERDNCEIENEVIKIIKNNGGLK